MLGLAWGGAKFRLTRPGGHHGNGAWAVAAVKRQGGCPLVEGCGHCDCEEPDGSWGEEQNLPSGMPGQFVELNVYFPHPFSPLPVPRNLALGFQKLRAAILLASVGKPSQTGLVRSLPSGGPSLQLWGDRRGASPISLRKGVLQEASPSPRGLWNLPRILISFTA